MNSVRRGTFRGVTSLVLGLLTLHAGARAGDPPAELPPWSDQGQVTWLSATGNTRASTLGAANLLTVRRSRVVLEIGAGAMGATSRHVVLAEQYHATEKLRWNLGDRNFLFERVGWESNRFAGFADRVDSSLGAGRQWVKTATQSLLAEAGVGYVDEQRLRAPRVSFASARAFAKYVLAITGTSSFTQDAEYLHNLQHPAGFRLKTETALAAAMSTHVSLKVSYVFQFANEPVRTFGKTDTLTAAALIVNL